MTDLPEKRKELNQESADTKALLRTSIHQINRERANKSESE